MKAKKIAMLLPLVAGLLLSVTGCFDYEVPKSITGGGFLDGCDGKVNFGFNVHISDVECDLGRFVQALYASGQFQLVDHTAECGNIIVHGTFENACYKRGDMVINGVCTIKGYGNPNCEYDFTMKVEDHGEPGVCDYICVEIDIPRCPDLKYKGILDGGNIKVHD